MAIPLLTTKLHAPLPRPDLVPRPALIERLNAGLASGCRLTLVSAPAGFGKTTLTSAWVAGSGRPVAWLTLDEADSDPAQFLTYLIAAFQRIDEALGTGAAQVLDTTQLGAAEAVLTTLINEAASASPMLLVLDDYHLITAPSVHRALSFFVENLPPSLHLVLITREDPPLPLPRLRARGMLTELRERDLRFTPEEATIFLNQSMELGLDAEAVGALETRTEGWIAGLQLAALALQRDPAGGEAFIADFAGSDRYVMDYLISEVVEQQPEDVRGFLHQTAVLDRLSGPLCDAVTGREDSRAVLERLEAANLFLFGLDRRREWYRYHRLFAEVLRITVPPAEQRSIHERAMTWYREHGYPSDAIRHALAAGVPEQAAALIHEAVEAKLLAGSVLTVQGWLEALPPALIRADGRLLLARGWTYAMSGEMAPAWVDVQAAEAALREADAPDVELGKVLTLRSFVALLGEHDYAQAQNTAEEALALLGEDESHWRLIALWTLAEARERTAPITEAIEAFREAGRVGRALGNQVFASMVEMSLAMALNAHGERQEAVYICRAALDRFTGVDGELSAIAAPTLGELARLLYEANELEQAMRYHDLSRELADRMAVDSYSAVALGLSGPTLNALGRTEEALAALRKAQQGSEHIDYSDPALYRASEVTIRLAHGDLRFAEEWAADEGFTPEAEPHYLEIEQHVAYARLLLAQENLDAAQRWLTRLEAYTDEYGLTRWLISVRILQALLADAAGQPEAAHEALSEALRLAAPQGYLRAFLDEDAHYAPARPLAAADRAAQRARAGSTGPGRRGAAQSGDRRPAGDRPGHRQAAYQ
jgi:LuxR family maltose regulon positive regulatory protein